MKILLLLPLLLGLMSPAIAHLEYSLLSFLQELNEANDGDSYPTDPDATFPTNLPAESKSIEEPEEP